jgi:hypothetical protein
MINYLTYVRLMEAPLLLATGPVIDPQPINQLICRLALSRDLWVPGGGDCSLLLMSK